MGSHSSRSRTVSARHTPWGCSRASSSNAVISPARAALASCPEQSPASDGEALIRYGTIELLLEEGRWEQALAEADALLAGLRSEDGRLGAMAVAEGAGARCARTSRRSDRPARRRAGRGTTLGRSWALARTLRLLGTMQREQGHELARGGGGGARHPGRLEHAKALLRSGRPCGTRGSPRRLERRSLEALRSPAAAVRNRWQSAHGRSLRRGGARGVRHSPVPSR